MPRSIQSGDYVTISLGMGDGESQLYSVETISPEGIYVSSIADVNKRILLVLKDGKWNVSNTSITYNLEFKSKDDVPQLLFTNIPDVDIQILTNLDDKTLGLVCQLSTYAKSLCDNDQLWKKRFGEEYEKKFTKNRTKNFKILYEERKVILNKLKEFILTFGPNMERLPDYIKVDISKFTDSIFEEMMTYEEDYGDDYDDDDSLYLSEIYRRIFFSMPSNVLDGDALYTDYFSVIYDSYNFAIKRFVKIYEKVELFKSQL